MSIPARRILIIASKQIIPDQIVAHKIVARAMQGNPGMPRCDASGQPLH